MSKRRDLEQRIRTLGEIEGIMAAMKNLALMESVKLNRVLGAQHRVVESLETAGRDFLTFYPSLSPPVGGTGLYLMIGTERGFCGDFNDRLLAAFEHHMRTLKHSNPVLVVVGRKLVEQSEGTHRISAVVQGPTVSEEVQTVLIGVVDQIRSVAARHGLTGAVPVTVVYHDAVSETVVVRPLRPFASAKAEARPKSVAPSLTLPPPVFFAQLIDLYLFSLLHEIFYSALMAESRARLAHLETALHRLHDSRREWLQRRNVLRQEEITEEIEVLMLSADDTTLQW